MVVDLMDVGMLGWERNCDIWECTVEEQIDETDIRKIPQIVWAESGSLTVPV